MLFRQDKNVGNVYTLRKRCETSQKQQKRCCNVFKSYQRFTNVFQLLA